jgi:hypothetical protein
VIQSHQGDATYDLASLTILSRPVSPVPDEAELVRATDPGATCARSGSSRGGRGGAAYSSVVACERREDMTITPSRGMRSSAGASIGR